MKALNVLAKGAGIAFLGIAFSKGAGYIYRIIVARISPEDYGLLSLSLALFGIISIISMMGLNIGVTRFVANYKAHNQPQNIKNILKNAIKFSLFTSIPLAIMLFLLADVIGQNIFHSQEIAYMLRIFSFLIPFHCSREMLLSAVKAYTKNISYDVIARNVGESSLKVIISAVLVWLGFGVLGAVIGYFLAILSSAIYSYYTYIKYLRPFLKGQQNKFDTKELIYFSLPLMFNMLLIQVIAYTDLLMMGYFLSPTAVGIYNAALPTATLLSVFPGGVIALFLPVMTDLYEKNLMKKFKETLLTSARWIFIINLPLFLFLFMYSSRFLGRMFGEEYIEGALSLSILSIGYMVYKTFNTSVESLSAIKKTKLVLFNTVIAAISNASLNLLLIPKYGMIGGAIATSFSLCLTGIMAAIEIFHITKIIPFKIDFLKSLVVGALTISVAGFFTIPNYLPYEILFVGFFFGFYFLLCMFIINKDDKELLRNFKSKVTG
jgi:O-antigen/teichoic acid export membrane protein